MPSSSITWSGSNDSVASQSGPHTIETFVALLAKVSAAMSVLAAEPREKGPSLFDIEEQQAPTLYPTKLRPAHLVLGVGFLLAAAIASILVGPADLAPGADIG